MKPTEFTTDHPVARAPLSIVLIGGLAIHGTLPAETVIERADAMGLDIDAQARAVLDLVNRGLVSVTREGDVGRLTVTPKFADLPQTYRVHCITAYLGHVKAAARGQAHA